MYLTIVSMGRFDVEVKEGTLRQSTRRLRVPFSSSGLLDTPWGVISSSELFYKARRSKVGGTIHIIER